MSRDAEQGLAPRELEVARLVRDGLTDRDIAVTLDIARRTAEWHVQQIFNKLGFNTRTQIAAWTARDEVVGTAARSPDTRQHNLPLQLTTFVGRAQELATAPASPGNKAACGPGRGGRYGQDSSRARSRWADWRYICRWHLAGRPDSDP